MAGVHGPVVAQFQAIAVIRSTNIDIRAFALNAEFSLVVFDPASSPTSLAFSSYFANSDLLAAAEWSRRRAVTRVAQNVARLADSLL